MPVPICSLLKEPGQSYICYATAHPGKFQSQVSQDADLRPPLPPQLEGLLEREQRFVVSVSVSLCLTVYLHVCLFFVCGCCSIFVRFCLQMAGTVGAAIKLNRVYCGERLQNTAAAPTR